jgi:aminoacyl tRNA synthase complex-interacting multifunctional protein 1
MKFSAADSAIATLTVAASELQDDILLQIIVKAASNLQLTVKTPKKASLELSLLSGVVLTQRNSIIRCICGMGLHNVLDSSPHFLLGGHSATVASSSVHAMALASVTSWMSVAEHSSSAGSKSDDFVIPLLEQINDHLCSRSFLIDSPTITVADIDVARVLLKSKPTVDVIPNYPHALRWILTVQDVVNGEYGLSFANTVFKPTASQVALPLFFYGNEVGAEPPKALNVAKPVAGGGKDEGSQKGGKQQQQQQQQKQAQPAKGKQPKQSQQQQQQAAGSDSFDISALDIRVGEIKKVWPHPEAEKLFCEEIDVGEDQPRQIASGLRPFYKTEDLENRRVVVLCNLKKRNLVGFPSHGMVLCASNADHTQVQCMEPPGNAKIGDRVIFEGFESGEPEPENKIAKKKIFEAVSPDLKTNSNGICVWKGAISKVGEGGNPIKASLQMPDAQVS